jgi:hypothetical protein
VRRAGRSAIEIDFVFNLETAKIVVELIELFVNCHRSASNPTQESELYSV